jgi:hypothetical protein
MKHRLEYKAIISLPHKKSYIMKEMKMDQNLMGSLE